MIAVWAYVVLSVLSFFVYAFDKSAAQRGARRVSERSLHLLALAGGWPGALLAQRMLRHKTRKVPFRRVFWGTVLLNITGFVLLNVALWPERSPASSSLDEAAGQFRAAAAFVRVSP